MFEYLNSWATAIGWLVIAIAGIVFANKIMNSSNEEKRKRFEEEHNIRTIAYEISLRRIYFMGDDNTRDLVKSYSMTPGCGVNGWAMLELDLSDAQFAERYSKLGRKEEFLQAENRIKERGFPLLLDKITISRRW